LRVLCVLFLSLAMGAGTLSANAADMPPSGAQTLGVRPLVIAHRGASGHVPEHTLESYALAIAQGADYIEVDLVLSQDGYLVARHENNLADTTDVAQRYPDRKSKRVVDGREEEGWFSEDFTLVEIQTLGAKERLPFRSQAHNSNSHVPTIAEILVLRAEKQRETGRSIGVYIETKHPGYYRAMGIPMEERLLSILKAWALDRPGAPVFLQSFEADSVKRMTEGTSAPVIQLLSEPSQTTDASLAVIATYAKGIGPAKSMIIPVDDKGNAGTPTDLVQRAHKAGLLVHPYTFRPEKQFLPVTYGGDDAKEYCAFAALGIDGLFTDTPDRALKAFTESCPISRPSAP